MKRNNIFADPISWLYLFAATLPFLMVSPWQTVFSIPIGFISASILMIFMVLLAINGRKLIRTIFNNENAYIYAALLMLVLFEGLSLMLNWGMSHRSLYSEWAVGLRSPHVYNIFLLVFMAFNVVVFVSVQSISGKKGALTDIIKAYMVSSVLACFYGILILLGYEAGFKTPQLYPTGSGIPARLHATATEPQVFASFLLSSLPIAWILFLTDAALIKQWAFRITLFVLTLSMYLTFGITGWVGMAAGITMILFIPGAINKRKVLEFAVMVLLVVLTVNILTIFAKTDYNGGMNFALNKLKVWELGSKIETYNRAEKTQVDIFDEKKVYAGNDTKLDRYWMAMTAVNMFRSHPILGVGIGNYAFLYNDYKPKGSPIKPHLPKPHNAYLEILAESGILGFISFLTFLSLLLIRSIKYVVYAKNGPKLLAIGLLACYIALLVNAVTFGILAHTFSWFVFALLLVSVSDKRGR